MKKFEGLKYFTNKAVLKTIKTIRFMICQQIFDNGKLFFSSNISKIWGINFGIFQKFAMISLDVNNLRSARIRQSRLDLGLIIYFRYFGL